MASWYGVTIALGRAAMYGLDITTRWRGEEHLPASGPVLLASNHVSYPDFLFIGRAALSRDRYVRFMCRHDIWNVPVVRDAMTSMRHIPVDREAAAAAYLRARSLLAEGEAVCGFPEAGISYSYAVRSMMPGVAALARETGVPIVPVVVWGSQRLASVGRRVDGREPRPDLRRGRTVDVRFGEPIAVPRDADLVATTRDLGERLTGMLESVQRLPVHRPRAGEYAPWYPAHLGGHAPDRREALLYDDVPRSAVSPTWGPPLPDPARIG
ncbi:1-acyl-sn-glycerol-3-phosphate acyltransferase [Nocardioides ginsengisegetis]|uniref:1-acyl-sn-glycerol-3-phosphate acyltransferase n=1 Tax=Nocardioides ginsengisegetis TaxID=661491 RepID=A0A7W3J2K5_9ACTN|nr:lysophospholipid acyltransferase family protein [Nocardioides ginsengisegetis]MBA8805054.1 1-acyl-sn-glycerol-3-phosphate acyltransferase [Nocardioides ginsengisegetis]